MVFALVSTQRAEAALRSRRDGRHFLEAVQVGPDHEPVTFAAVIVIVVRHQTTAERRQRERGQSRFQHSSIHGNPLLLVVETVSRP